MPGVSGKASPFLSPALRSIARSDGLIGAAAMRTRTCPTVGCGTGISFKVSLPPGSFNLTAFIVGGIGLFIPNQLFEFVMDSRFHVLIQAAVQRSLQVFSGQAFALQGQGDESGVVMPHR